MVAQTQADRIEALVRGGMHRHSLWQFTKTLKADFESILLETLAAVKGAEDAAVVQNAADLCARRCQEKLLEQMSEDSTLGDAVVQAVNSSPISQITKQLDESLKCHRCSRRVSSCSFFDLTNTDELDDASTSAGSSRSASDMDHHEEEEEDSIEFMFGKGFLTINFNKQDEHPDGNKKLQKDKARTLEDRNGQSSSAKPASGKKLSREDLASLDQHIKNLRVEFEATKAKSVHVSSLFAKPTAISDSRFPKSFRVSHLTQAHLSNEANSVIESSS